MFLQWEFLSFAILKPSNFSKTFVNFHTHLLLNLPIFQLDKNQIQLKIPDILEGDQNMKKHKSNVVTIEISWREKRSQP